MERFPFAHLAPDWGLATDHTADVEEIKDLGIPEEVAVRIKESLTEKLTDKKSTS